MTYAIENRRRTTFTFPFSSSTILCVAPAGSLPSLFNRAASPDSISDSTHAASSSRAGCPFAADGRDTRPVVFLAALLLAGLRFEATGRFLAGLGTVDLSREL